MMCMRSYIKTVTSFSAWLIFAFASMLFIPLCSLAQQGKKEKEVISITSNFKPSIVRTGKIEFYADPLQKDTGKYVFTYPELDIPFSTNLTSFVIRPLAFKTKTTVDSSSTLSARLGYGNWQTPLASVAYQRTVRGQTLSSSVEHLSSKGGLKDQQFSQNRLGVGFAKRINENNTFSADLAVDRQSYRLYGFDHSLFDFSPSQLAQYFNSFQLNTTYDLVTGETANLQVTPKVKLGYLSASRATNELTVGLDVPIVLRKSQTLKLAVEPGLQTSRLRVGERTVSAASLIQLPIRSTYVKDKLALKLGLVPALLGGDKVLLPELTVSHGVGDDGLRLFAGIENRVAFNNYAGLYLINPFLAAPDSMTIGRTRDLHMGVDYQNGKGFQVVFKAAWLHMKDQALFVNWGVSGKDFRALIESKLSALSFATDLTYTFSSDLVLGADFRIYSFLEQVSHGAMYGWLPAEGTLKADWKPLKGLTTTLRVKGWSGPTARSISGQDFKINGAIDINMGAEYAINKSWAVWLDLNNIANSQYQRWNQYQVIGFNAIAGVRYAFR